jgi:hypothetical protein
MANHDSVVRLDFDKLLGFRQLGGKGEQLPALGDEARTISPEILGATFNKAGEEGPRPPTIRFKAGI